MGWFSSTPALPELPAFGPLPAAEAATYFGKHLNAHAHLFPSENAVAWEAVRGWDVNEEPSSLEGQAPVRIAVVTDRLLHFCPPKKKLECFFDFLLHRIEGVEFDPNSRPSDAPPGVGLLSIYTPSGRTLMVCSQEFAATLDRTIQAAHAWAEEHGLD